MIFAGGSGFNPSIRVPQIRISHYVTPTVRLIGIVCTYAYHRPIEPSGNNSQRNSGLPDLQFQVQYGNPKQFFAAVTAGYKFLKPYLTTWSPIDSSTYKSTKVVGSYNLQGCIEYNFPFLSIKLQGNLGENLTGYTMIGGYGPVEGSMNAKGEWDYANMTTGTLWADFETKGDKVKLGLFGGIAKNLGSENKNIIFLNGNGVNTKKDLCRDADLQQVFRVSPRVKINSGNVSFGFEYILTGAVYGTYNGNRISVTEKPTYDSRFLAMVQYTF